jgi:hypothetical protein
MWTFVGFGVGERLRLAPLSRSFSTDVDRFFGGGVLDLAGETKIGFK